MSRLVSLGSDIDRHLLEKREVVSAFSKSWKIDSHLKLSFVRRQLFQVNTGSFSTQCDRMLGGKSDQIFCHKLKSSFVLVFSPILALISAIYAHRLFLPTLFSLPPNAAAWSETDRRHVSLAIRTHVSQLRCSRLGPLKGTPLPTSLPCRDHFRVPYRSSTCCFAATTIHSASITGSSLKC